MRTLIQSEVSDYQMYEMNGSGASRRPSRPARSSATRDDSSALSLLRLDNQQVFRVFKDYNGLGSTGEAMAAKREGQSFTFVAPPRSVPDAAFNYRGRIGD